MNANSLPFNQLRFESLDRQTVQRRGAIEQHRVKPVIDRVFPFAEANEALRYLEAGAHFGKVVISV